MSFKLIFTLALAALAFLFIIQNVAAVEIKFLFWSIQLSCSLLIFLLLTIGIILGWFLREYFKYRKSKGDAV